MSTRSRAAARIWRGRRPRTRGDRAYAGYLVVLVAVVVVVPTVRAMWLGAVNPGMRDALTSPAMPGAVAWVVAVLWAGALMCGRERGPALHDPFPTYALAVSDLPRWDAFGAALLRGGAVVVALTTGAAGLVGGVLLAHGVAGPLGAVGFALAGALVGVIATVAWLAGQAGPRVAAVVAVGILAVALAGGVVPIPFAPWGWVAGAYPVGGTSGASLALGALAALAVGLTAAAPAMMSRLSLAVLVGQAVRWDAARTHTAMLDVGAASAVYQRFPRLGRRICAVRPAGGSSTMFLFRDAVGALRMPGRLLLGVGAAVTAAVLVTVAFAPAMPGWLLGAMAGVLIFMGLGPVTDGVRHAASVASGTVLYGVSDERLLASHLLFPVVAVVVVMLAAALLGASVLGVGSFAPAMSSLVLGMLSLIARVGMALKRALPSALLAPIPTPIGDFGAAVRLAWALDAILLSALAGVAAVLVFQAPALLVAVSGALLAVAVVRWRAR